MAWARAQSWADGERLVAMGWSHGGYIALLSVFRDEHPFRAAAAIVPVTNLLGGQEGQGFYQLMAQLPQERLAIAITGVRLPRSARRTIQSSAAYESSSGTGNLCSGARR